VQPKRMANSGLKVRGQVPWPLEVAASNTLLLRTIHDLTNQTLEIQITTPKNSHFTHQAVTKQSA
ncbi:hypothetical protein OAO01_06565, partial [Oligoflexia bacterium]|nr:hypothetical protein [Oligoflexia bacterium]